MAYTWHVFIVDRRPGGAGVQDVSLYYQAGASNLRGEARPKTEPKKLNLLLDDPLVGFQIDSFMEVWAGWFDDGTSTWDPDRIPFGGYIIDHTGGALAANHTLDLLVVGYEHWAKTTAILTWPVLTPDDPQAGFAVDKTVQEWLVDGDGTYAGLISAHSSTVQVALAANIAALTLTVEHTPGIPLVDQADVTGMFAFVYIADALDEIARAIHDQDDSIRPLVFWTATPDGADLVPQLHIIDLNDTSVTPLCTVNTTPTTGHVTPAQPVKHRRNAQPAAQGVITKGIGGDPTLSGNPIVYYRQVISGHNDAYPNYHSSMNTFDLLVKERTLATVAEAQSYAERIETQVWGPRGSITFDIEEDDLLAAVSLTLDALQIGAALRYIDSMEGLDRVYPIVAVERDEEIGTRRATVTIGLVPLDYSDLLTGGTAEMPWLREGLSAAEYARRQAIGTPPATPPMLAPQQANENAIKPRWIDVPALQLEASASRDPRVPDTDPVIPSNILEVRPPPVLGVRQAPGTWVDPVVGGPHPQEYHTGPVTTNGTVLLTVINRPCTISMIRLAGTGTFQLLRDGTPVGSLFTSPGLNILSPGIDFAAGQELDGVTASVVGYLKAVVAE